MAMILLYLVVNGQSQDGPELSLRGQLIPNNGFVSVQRVGETNEDALLCSTDGSSCCSDQVPEQRWLFPNGTRVPLGETGWTYWTTYGDGVIRLHHRFVSSHEDEVFGLFRCQLPNQNRVSLTFYVGIYSTNESKCSECLCGKSVFFLFFFFFNKGSTH